MAFTNQTNRTSATGSAAVGQVIPYTFPISDTSDLAVYKRITATGVETLLTETTNYTVTIDGDSGGNVTTVTAIAATEQIHIIRDTPNTQELDLEQGGSFNAENIEDAIDKNTKLNIENLDQLDRTLKFSDTDPSSSFSDMPNSIDRASKNLTFDATGKPTASSSVETGTVAFTAIGEDIAGAANALAERALLELDTTDDVEFAAIAGTTGTFSGAVSGTTGTFSGAGSFSGFADIKTKSPWVDVTHPDFGADDTGATDATAAIQAAVDSFGQDTTQTPTGGGIVLLPPGTFKVDSQINVYSGVYIVGSGQGSTIIDASALGAAGSWVFKTISNCNYFGFEGMTIDGSNQTVSAGGIKIGNDSGDAGKYIAHFYVRDLIAKNFWKAGSIGLSLTNPSHGVVANVTTTGMNGAGGIGCLIKANKDVTGVISFNGCKFGSPYVGVGTPCKTGLKIAADTAVVDVGELTFNGCFFGGDTYGIDMDVVTNTAMIPRNIAIRGCMFESDFSTAALKISNAHNLSVENCGFHGHGVAPVGVLFDRTGDARNVRIQNNSFVDILTDCVKLTASGVGRYENITVGGFFLQSSTPTHVNDTGGYATLLDSILTANNVLTYDGDVVTYDGDILTYVN